MPMDPVTLGLNVAQGFLAYGAEKAQAKAAKARQKYMNSMTMLSAALNTNSIAYNDVATQNAYTQEGVNVQRRGIIAEAQGEAQAAAAGVAGRSVNQAMMDLQRGTAEAEYKRTQDMLYAKISSDVQRTQTSMSAAMQQDHSYIPKPSLLGHMLNAVASSYKPPAPT